MVLTPEQWTTQTSGPDFSRANTRVTAPEWVSFHFGWNIDTPFFADRRVRRAMSYAFDHDAMLEKLCYGLYEPAMGTFHQSSWMAPKKKLEPYKQDLDKAEALLDEAGWTDHDNDGVRDKEKPCSPGRTRSATRLARHRIPAGGPRTPTAPATATAKRSTTFRRRLRRTARVLR